MTVLANPGVRSLVVDIFSRYRLPLSDEKDLQAKIAQMLTLEKVPFVREVRLDDEGKDIVDFIVGAGALLQPLAKGCAVEVKIGGSRRAIFRQLDRYCTHAAVEEIVLATNVPMSLPFEINGRRASWEKLALNAQFGSDDLLAAAARLAWREGEAHAPRTYGIIMSLRSGAGLDGLQHRCSTVVHGELDWSREVHKQLAGRLRPHARPDPITEIFIVADGGSDPLIASVQGLKASQARGIIDPKAGLEQVHSDESRIKALAKMYLEKGQ